MAHAGPGSGAGHRGSAGVGEQVEHVHRPAGLPDLLLGPVPVGGLLRKQAGVLEVHGLDIKGEAAVGDGPPLRHRLVLPLSPAAGGAGIPARVALPAPVGPGGVPNGLGIRPDQKLVPPALQFLPAGAVDQFIVLPLVGKPHRDATSHLWLKADKTNIVYHPRRGPSMKSTGQICRKNCISPGSVIE